MADTLTLSLIDGTRIVVPNSLSLMTPYVLREQLDWFEDEIRFLRRCLVPGSKVIDIGANYGVYTLCMAKAVGDQGFVWAFEPSSICTALLAAGIEANGFRNVVVEQSAVSRESGMGRLALNDNTELNALIRTEDVAQVSESVSVVTLDECLLRYGWGDIDFLKIDAEGEEASIVEGGRRFLAERSPIVQYEVKVDDGFRLELVRAFSEIGYRSYRLVPQLGILVPFHPHLIPDRYLLNLFCCKPGRAAQLAARGFLLEHAPESSPSATQVAEHLRSLPTGDRYTWQALTQFPYGAQLATAWLDAAPTDERPDVEDAITCYIASRDDRLSAPERFVALNAGFESLTSLCALRPENHLRLASLARAAGDYGARSAAVAALQQLATTIMQGKEISLSEPFLSPSARFDSLSVGNALVNWLLASVLEQLELLSSYSSFFPGNSARGRLELIARLGFASPEMERRLDLVRTRFGEALPRS